MKKILIVAYSFPPIAGGGIQRTLKFIKYLPEFGFEPIIFCPEKALWKVNDKRNLELNYLKDKKIYRVGIKKLQRYYEMRFKKNIDAHPYYYLLGLKYMWFLDYFSSWYFECHDQLLKIAKEEKVDFVFTTSPPHSVHLFGRYLKKHLGIPWIMDLRDAMFNEPNNDFNSFIHKIQKTVDYLYEKSFYHHSDAIISVSEPIIESIKTRHNKYSLDKKIHVITNGFDEDDFNKDKNSNNNNKFIITYTGNFLKKCTPEYFLEAVALLVFNQEINKSDFIIRFVGPFENKVMNIFQKYSKILPLEIIEFQSYDKAIKYQMESDMLLLVVTAGNESGGEQIFTGKFFEYIGAKVPIFALIPDGPLKDIIHAGNFGITEDSHNTKIIAERFLYMYNQWKKDRLKIFKPDLNLRASYTRRRITGKLVEILKKL